MSRKIKDIKDKHTGELVYPRTHVSAVVLSSDSTLEDLVEVKQDKIDDLDEIRAGAAKGATALQSVPAEYVTETELSNKGYATISALNNKVDAINGKQLSTEDFTTALKNKLEGLNNYDDTELSEAIETLRGDFDNIVSGDTTTAIKTFNEVIAFLDGLTDTQDLESIIANIEQQIAGKMDKVTLAKVATSGSYNDLTNKPFNSFIYNREDVIVATDGSTFNIPIVDSSAYIKHIKGIEYDYEKVDLSTVGISFITESGEGDWEIHKRGDGTKFLSDDGTYKTAGGGSGTITGVSANGTSVATSGVANIPAASTSVYGVTKLSSATNSTSTTEAATPSAVKSAYDLANSYKGTVTSVKVDNVSKSQSSGVVDLGYINKQLSTSTSSSMTLSPNIYYRNTNTSLSTLTITLGSVSNSNIINEYFVEFTTRSAGTTVSLPSTIKWANGEAPTFEASTTYQISIVNNLGTIQKFK